MHRIVNILTAVLVRATYFVVGTIPHGVRIRLFAGILRILFKSVPRFRKTIYANLKIAFPDSDRAFREEVLVKNCTEIARLISDSLRLHKLDKEWTSKHVSCPSLERYVEVLSKGKGILIVTGHLGSFELLGHAIGLFGHPLAAIARNFRNPYLDTWWRGLREARGNTIIDRTGAFKETIAKIEQGTSVAILFDQNVTKNHAVFVDLFGVPAATTKSVALAAVKTRAPIFVASMRYSGEGMYVIDSVECDVTGTIDNPGLTTDQKVVEITQIVTAHFEHMIRAFPEGWFWIHRRWKTRPDGDQARIYN